MSDELVVLARLELGEQLPGVLPNLGEFRDECLPVHLSCNVTIAWKFNRRRCPYADFP
jgi:hypothetical protein